LDWQVPLIDLSPLVLQKNLWEKSGTGFLYRPDAFCVTQSTLLKQFVALTQNHEKSSINPILSSLTAAFLGEFIKPCKRTKTTKIEHKQNFNKT